LGGASEFSVGFSAGALARFLLGGGLLGVLEGLEPITFAAFELEIRLAGHL
jgi:hypothetical protein